MNKGIMLAGAIACALLGAQSANACATVTFTQNPVVGWNPLTGMNGTATLTVTALRTDANARLGRIIFTDREGTQQLGVDGTVPGPDYEIRDANGQRVSFASGTLAADQSIPNNIAWGTGRNSENASAQFTLTVFPSPSRDYVATRDLGETLGYSIICFQENGRTVAGSTSAPTSSLSLTVPSLLNIVTAGPQTLNFGNFTTALQQLNIGLKSTSNINVAVATQNNNQLALANAPTPFAPNSVIPYTMTLNGKAIASGTSLTNETRAGVAGTNWPFVLSLTGGLPSGKVAGTYSDTITLTLTPN